MRVRNLGIDGVIEITPVHHCDNRGYFSETWSYRSLAGIGVTLTFVQDNQSLSVAASTLRGLHFQSPPHAQAKLVRVLRGAIFDVAVDIRKGSPTFGRWVGTKLSSAKGNQLLVPAGFAHGYVTLLPNTEVAYKVSDYYSREYEFAIRFDDPMIGIEWPTTPAPFVLSDRDQSAPSLAEIDTGFSYP